MLTVMPRTRIMQLLILATMCAGISFGQFSKSGGDFNTWTTKEVARGWDWGDADGKLSEVRAARNTGFDRVVFEFADDVPAFTIRYVDPPITGEDDEPVQIAGKAFIEVRFKQYYGESDHEKVFKGYPKGKLNSPALLEIKDTYWFETLQIYVLGTRKKAAFRVSHLRSPARLVIDIGH